MKMLLLIEALLLISALQDHRTSADDGQIFPLDMSLNSVDDLYVGCKKRMSCLVESVLLENELDKTPNFRTVWNDSLEHYKTPGDELKKFHSVAIYAYTCSSRDRKQVYRAFNNAGLNDKQKYKDKTYSWYSLQFLLTEAIQTLKETQIGCKSTYHGTEIEFNDDVLNKQVRFGSFTSSSLNRNEAKVFGTKSCFEITTCEGADVTKYSKYDTEKEVLIPPYEVFKVKEIKTRSAQKNLWCETVFVLESIGVRSDLNCDWFKRPITSIINRSRFRKCKFGLPYQAELRLRLGYTDDDDVSRFRRVCEDSLTKATRSCRSV